MSFHKEDLLNSHYTWSKENKNPVFTGTASRRLFDRHNGDQVLFIINLCAESSGNLTVEEGRRLEKMIMDELPIETRSELSVLHWLMAVLH
jgi:hypothetical protein